jgi:hypothetical protein
MENNIQIQSIKLIVIRFGEIMIQSCQISDFHSNTV